MVYIKEAHPEDEWQTQDNATDGICYPQPRSLEERIAIANDFISHTAFDIPVLIDTMANEAMEDYSAWPERMFVLSAKGRVRLVGGPGPVLFDPDVVEEWLEDRFGPTTARNHATTRPSSPARRD